jgi:hypothetical protein
MRHMLSIRFYDAVTKAAVSPTQVKVNLVDPDGATSLVTMTEIQTDEGHYQGSFIPATTRGDWRYTVTHASVTDVLDAGRFYVSG